MSEYITQKRVNGQIKTGIFATIFCFILTCIGWPIYGTIVKAIITAIAGNILNTADPALVTKYIACFTEATFFWCIINSWVWLVLLFGNCHKYNKTEKQPGAGLWMSFLGLIVGIGGFIALVGFIGVWWKPFSLSILFTPKTVEELNLAILGWEASNFFCLAVLIAQIPFSSLFQKKPFAGNTSSPFNDGLGVFMMSCAAALIVWVAVFIPSFFHSASMGGMALMRQPFGSWPAVLAFCQGFIFWFLMPAEGGELYPMKLFAKKQPWMGLTGLVIAFVFGGFLMPKVIGSAVQALNLFPDLPVNLTVASLELSMVCWMLTWHHLFDDYPNAEMVPGTARRVLTRMAIWVVGGLVFGFIWLKTYTLLPYGTNNMGLGYPNMGLIAGQFALLMPILYLNTYFDKWPFASRVKKETLDKGTNM